MPRGPKGEKRPADVIGNAVHIMRIATGEIVESAPSVTEKRVHAGQRGGLARAKVVGPQKRTEIAKKAAVTRWKRKKEQVT
jgi:hypothetical protein